MYSLNMYDDDNDNDADVFIKLTSLANRDLLHLRLKVCMYMYNTCMIWSNAVANSKLQILHWKITALSAVDGVIYP